MKKDSKQNILLANATIGDLFANANPSKLIKIKSKFIINDFLTKKDFKKNGKLSKKYIKKNFVYAKPKPLTKTIVKNLKNVKRCILTKKSYYTSHPIKYYLNLAGKGLKRGVACIAVVVVGYFGVKYGPGAVKFISDWYEASHLPQTQIMAEFNPQTNNARNEDYLTINIQQKPSSEIKVNDATKSSYNDLKEELGNLNKLYTGTEGALIPSLITIDKENDLINLFCKTDDSALKFVFDVYDHETFNSTFNMSEVLSSDVINGLKILLTDENISDIPENLNSVANNLFASDVKKEVIGKIIDGEYIENDYYTFHTTEIDNDEKIFDKEVKIETSKAENFDDFDINNINSLLNIYKNSPKSFEISIKKEYNTNFANKIFSAINSEKHEQTLE